ncbi:MAG: hypothetical protein ACM3WU_07940 [Bacillota bacterium]
MSRRALTIILVVAALGVAASGCLPGDGTSTPSKPAGFFWGIWHGWMAPISLIGEIVFNRGLHIYESYNVGWAYDLGYYMAVISGFGGLSLVRRRSSHDRRR